MIGRLKSFFHKQRDLFKGIDPETFPFVYEKAYFFKGLLNNNLARFEVQSEKLFLIIQGLKFQVTSKEEIFILYEIFVEDAYNLNSCKPFIFIDIGLNAGFTTLFFAKQENAVMLYGFEPFLETFNQAKINIGLNPAYSGKIEIKPIGLSSEDRDLELDYSFDYKGNVGIHGITQDLIDSGVVKDLKKASIRLRKASAVLQPIIDKHPEQLKILKLDCEGSEYDILPELDSSHLLKQFNIVMLEWHFKGYSDLLSILGRNGFSTLVKGVESGNVGLLVAFKEN